LIVNTSNPTGGWALENLPVFEELAAAVEQLALEAGQAIGSVDDLRSLDTSADALKVARGRLAAAVAAVRDCPSPPDDASARCLQASLIAFEEFIAIDSFDEWGAGFVKAVNEYVAFTTSLAGANEFF
jgi:hypothetical protein